MALPLDLKSSRWSELEAYSGNASDVPALLRRFRKTPNAKTFHDLRGCLIGDGDIKATSAFYAALPHIVEVLRRSKPRLREEALCHLGWAAALAAFESPPASIRAAYKVGLAQMGSMAAEALHAGGQARVPPVSA